jgi:NAD+ kinase
MLFQDRETPPVLSINPAHEGFISCTDFASHTTIIPRVLRGNSFLLARCRLSIEYHSLNGIERFCVLNDLCVNRDPYSHSLVIKCSSSGFGFSQVRGDGVIIATPTGSTAYNKAAGGALVHPLLPVFMMTPICALSLSARPILLPQSAELTIELEYPIDKSGHYQAIVTFDGMQHKEFKVGEKLVISVAPHSYNSIMMSRSVGDWPVRLAGLMGWNERKHQKPYS